MIGSLRYSPCGRKRKSKALAPVRRSKELFVPYKPVKSLRQIEIEAHNAKYPSYSGPAKYVPAEDQSYKIEASKGYTLAPAYNKGAYQVVPRSEVEYIGK